MLHKSHSPALFSARARLPFTYKYQVHESVPVERRLALEASTTATANELTNCSIVFSSATVSCLEQFTEPILRVRVVRDKPLIRALATTPTNTQCGLESVPPVLRTESVARGQTESFQNVEGGEVIYDVLTLQKSRGARAHLENGPLPLPPLNEFLHTC